MLFLLWLSMHPASFALNRGYCIGLLQLITLRANKRLLVWLESLWRSSNNPDARDPRETSVPTSSRQKGKSLRVHANIIRTRLKSMTAKILHIERYEMSKGVPSLIIPLSLFFSDFTLIMKVKKCFFFTFI